MFLASLRTAKLGTAKTGKRCKGEGADKVLGGAFRNHRSRLVVIAAVATVILVALAAAAVALRGDGRASVEASGGQTSAKASDGDPSVDPMAASGCPKAKPERLPPDALAGATDAALAYFERSEEAGGQYAVVAERGEYATHNEFYKNCTDLPLQHGKLLQKRSVEVHLIWPKMFPSASMSQRSVLVARFDGEYRVWAWVH